VTHAYEGGHPDHDSVALAVHAACALVARSGGAAPHIVEAPLYSAPSGDYVYAAFVPHDDAGATHELVLSPEEQELKRRMFERHATQAQVLESFTVERERFRLAPRYHFTAPPHAGDVGYERFQWQTTAKTWRQAAWRTLSELDLVDDLA